MKSKRILIVFGTRPEAVKMCPLVLELRSRQEFLVSVCVTGQHREMLDQVLQCFDVAPDYDLDIMRQNQTLFDISAAVLRGMEAVLDRAMPDMVLVHGDTTTSFAAALSAFYKQIPVGHVEAGLRTYDMQSPWPEEFNRQGIGLLAQHHFAPTRWAGAQLVKEHKAPENIHITGNTVIDALRLTVQKDYQSPLLDWAKGSKLLLVTAHRRENLGLRMARMFAAIEDVARDNPDTKVLFPMHKNPAVRAAAATAFKTLDRIKIIEPLDTFDFHNIMARAYLVLTDSGGLQEEAPSFGIPVLVMRDVTERPEGVEAGTSKLVGADGRTIYREVCRLLQDKTAYEAMARIANPYGDGKACGRIAEILKEALQSSAAPEKQTRAQLEMRAWA
jgi:UDP-N-acetylglucosamine 2-epimerase (non-hydrolysing)